MNKKRVVDVLREIAIFQALEGASPFEVMAFANGADALADWSGDLGEALRNGSLRELPGIGAGLIQVITELLETGEAQEHRELRVRYPEGILELTDVPGLGPKKIKRLHMELGIGSLAELEAAAHEERIRALKGFGARSEEQFVAGIEQARAGGRYASRAVRRDSAD